MRRGWILTFRAATAVLVVAALTGFGRLDRWLGPGLAIPLHVIILGAGIYILVYYSRKKNFRGFLDKLRRSQTAADETLAQGTEDEKLAIELQRYARRACATHSAQTEDYFVAELLPPRGLRARVIDDYEPVSHGLYKKTTVEGRLPPDTEEDGGEEILFPLIVSQKGQLHENLKVYGADGKTLLPVITHKECLQVVARILRKRIAKACRLSPAGRFPPHIDMVERKALQVIIQSCRNPEGNREDGDEAASMIQALRPTSPRRRSCRANGRHAVEENARIVAASLTRRLATHYVIAVAVQPDSRGRFIITYEQSIVPLQTPKDSTLWSRIKYKARFYLGARPVSVVVTMENAPDCNSYHLRVNAPEGLYLGKQEILPTSLRLPHYRFRPRQAQSHAYFYARDFPQVPEGHKPPVARFEYYETPPGSAFRAAIAATASFVLILVIGWIVSRKPDPPIEATFLLVFPAVAAAWLGFDAPSHRLLKGTLAGRFSLLVTTACSVAATGLLLAHRAFGKEFDWPRFPFGMSFLLVRDKWWGLLVLVMFANMATIIYIAVIRVWQFMQLSRH
jgi:hypothetical protein